MIGDGRPSWAARSPKLRTALLRTDTPQILFQYTLPSGPGCRYGTMAQPMFSSKYFDPLRHRDFALLWSGQAVSQLGDGVFTVTLALEALAVDRSASGLSSVLAARLVPALPFTLLGGAFLDRFPRRIALLSSEAPSRR